MHAQNRFYYYLFEMLIIRLQRTGKKNQADFRIVLAQKEAPVKKKFLEILGTYNPRKKTFKIKEDRVKELIVQNVALSPTVHNLLISRNLLEGKKVQAFRAKKKSVEAEAVEAKKESVAEATPADVKSVEASKVEETAKQPQEASKEEVRPETEQKTEEAPKPESVASKATEEVK